MNAEMIGGTGQLSPELLQQILQGRMLNPQEQQAMQQMQIAEELRGQSQQADPGSWTSTGAGTPSIYSANPLGPVAQVAQGYMGGRERRAGEQAMRDISQAEMGISDEAFKQRRAAAGGGIAQTQGGPAPQPAPQGGMPGMGNPQTPPAMFRNNPWISGGGFGGGQGGR